MDHLYPGFIVLVAVARAVFLVRRRSRLSPLPPAALVRRVAAGVGLPALMAIFSVDLFGALWVTMIFVVLPFDLLAAWLLGRVLAQAWCWPGWRLRLVAGVGFSVMVACELGAKEIGIRTYLLRQQARYERVLAHVRARPTVADGGGFEGIRYMVEPGPTRVAFPWPGGILDNWFGVVHDPSGSVLRAPNDPAIRRLFGGDMIGARHLWGPWYLCSFT